MVEIFNNKEGWAREVEVRDDGSRYIIDSKINGDGKWEYHEYNISADNKTHSHVHGTEDEFLGGHGEDERPWKD